MVGLVVINFCVTKSFLVRVRLWFSWACCLGSPDARGKGGSS